MGYAVELYFDKQTEQSIRYLRHYLMEQGITPTLGKLGDRPNVSLAVFPSIDCEILVPLVQEYANNMEPFNVQLSEVGTFPTNENVLFLSPVPTQKLLTYHQEFHDRLTKAKLIPSLYYVPANWTPHCSVEMNIPDEQLLNAMDLCKKTFKPLWGKFQEIGVVEFRPIKHLVTWPLLAKKH